VKALVLSRKNAPLAQNRRNGAPQGDALPEFIVSQAVPEAKRYNCASRRSMPLTFFKGQN